MFLWDSLLIEEAIDIVRVDVHQHIKAAGNSVRAIPLSLVCKRVEVSRVAVVDGRVNTVDDGSERLASAEIIACRLGRKNWSEVAVHEMGSE